MMMMVIYNQYSVILNHCAAARNSKIMPPNFRLTILIFKLIFTFVYRNNNKKNVENHWIYMIWYDLNHKKKPKNFCHIKIENFADDKIKFKKKSAIMVKTLAVFFYLIEIKLNQNKIWETTMTTAIHKRI